MCHDVKANFHSGIVEQEANVSKRKEPTIFTTMEEVKKAKPKQHK